jgi:hypothetical protein
MVSARPITALPKAGERIKSQKIGTVHKSVPPGGNFAGLDGSSFVGQASVRIKRKPEGQHEGQAAGCDNKWGTRGVQYLSMR